MAEAARETRGSNALGRGDAEATFSSTPAAEVDALCRTAAGTCGRCCHGPEVPDGRLRVLARRHARRFRALGASAETPWRLLVHEVLARRGLDLLLAPAVALPWIGGPLRLRFARRAACAFLGSDDAAGDRVACLLHPDRQEGRDVRTRAAFRLFRGLGCGDAQWRCAASEAWRRASPAERARFVGAAAGLGWPEYGRAAAGFAARRTGESPCR